MVFRKTLKKFCLRKFLVRVILDTSLLYRELPLPSSCCKGGLPSEIALQEGTLESEIVYRRVDPDFENRKNIFYLAHNDQGDINRGKKWFSEKL